MKGQLQKLNIHQKRTPRCWICEALNDVWRQMASMVVKKVLAEEPVMIKNKIQSYSEGCFFSCSCGSSFHQTAITTVLHSN